MSLPSWALNRTPSGQVIVKTLRPATLDVTVHVRRLRGRGVPEFLLHAA